MNYLIVILYIMLSRRWLRPSIPMTFIKSNNWYYKPHSQPASGVGGSCNRAILNAKRRRL